MKKRINPKSLANLRPQKAGEPGHNPVGKSNPELARLRQLTTQKLQELVSLLFQSNEHELKVISKNKFEQQGRRWAANLLLKGTENADEKKWEAILNRVVGKAPDTVLFGTTEKPTDKPKTPEEEYKRAKELALDIGLIKDDKIK